MMLQFYLITVWRVLEGRVGIQLASEKIAALACVVREEHSMDQCRSRLKLSENFERHWSIPISEEIHMDQSLVHTFSWGNSYGPTVLKVLQKFPPTLALVHGWLFPGCSGNFHNTTIFLDKSRLVLSLVAHDCGYPLSRYTCRATRVAADFLDFIAFCRCSTGVALHPLKILVSHLPPPIPGRCRTEIWV